MKTITLLQIRGPKSPSYFAIAKFLKDFLCSRYVVDLPPLLWFPILFLFVIPLRSLRLISRYKKVFVKGRPLSELESELILEKMKSLYPDKNIRLLYSDESYSFPLTGEDQLIPLFPFHSFATHEYMYDVMQVPQNAPQLSFKNSFMPEYADWALTHLQDFLRLQKTEVLLISFHGVPLRRREMKDPYLDQIDLFFEMVSSKLTHIKVYKVFQSRFKIEGKWTSPFIDDVVKDLGRQHIENVAVFAASFFVNCIETIVELDDELTLTGSSLGLKIQRIPPVPLVRLESP